MLKAHRMKHHRLSEQIVASFNCKSCDATFKTSGKLSLHMTKFRGNCSIWICPICKTELASKNLYKNHLRKHKKQPTKKDGKLCQICTRYFSSSGFYQHVRTSVSFHFSRFLLNILAFAESSSSHQRILIFL